MKHTATSVEEYLASLPEDRRQALEAVRKVILENKDPLIEESLQYGMIGYVIPHSVFPAGYHCDPKQPLPYASIASQKNYMALYIFCMYGTEEEEAWLRAEWKKAGKKLDMGKSCIRFKKLDDVPLDVVGALFRRAKARPFIEHYESVIATTGSKRKKASAQKKSAKKAAKRAKTTKAAKKTSAKKTVQRKAKKAAK
jgi:hypothetical protein